MMITVRMFEVYTVKWCYTDYKKEDDADDNDDDDEYVVYTVVALSLRYKVLFVCLLALFKSAETEGGFVLL